MSVAHLSKINNYLTVLVMLLGVYIMFSPILPAIINWWSIKHGTPSNNIISVEQTDINKTSTQEQTNRIVIPSINLDTEILEGQSEDTVNKGVWLRPNSAKPGEVSNSVLVGHRYSYNPGISYPFYSLDKVKTGDKVAVFWQGNLILYQVKQILIANPNATQIEQPTTSERLTLYTCTPLWTSINRLVIIAEPFKQG
jgi:sortase A